MMHRFLAMEYFEIGIGGSTSGIDKQEGLT